MAAGLRTGIGGKTGKTCAPSGQCALAELIILPALNAPGDGQHSLAASLSEILTANDVDVVETPTDRSFMIQSIVEVTKHDGHYIVRIVWELKNPKSEVIASMVQENEIPPGRLDAPWEGIAFFAAQGAAQGFMDVLTEVAIAATRTTH